MAEIAGWLSLWRSVLIIAEWPEVMIKTLSSRVMTDQLFQPLETINLYPQAEIIPLSIL